ncbi:hypothetical protein QEN19_004180 [Hanseniaspora menglaensis]
MNTIINVSNIFLKKTSNRVDGDAKVVSEDQETGQVSSEENKAKETFVPDDDDKIKDADFPQRTRSFSLSLICYKIAYEVIICLFYIILSPVYFFDTYTINSSQDDNQKDLELHLTKSEDSVEERLFFPKKLIPQSVMSRRKILILDLDETLIHSTNISEEPLISSKSAQKIEFFQTEVSFRLPKNTHIPSIFANSQKLNNSKATKETDITTIYKIKQRPHLIQFLKTCNLWYDMIIYTASLREYSEPIINHLEYLSGVSFKGRLYRNDCKVSAGGYVKPLDHILRLDFIGSSNNKKVGKEGMVILDNMAVSFQDDVSNGIEVESWYSRPDDIELLKLLPLLEGLRNVADVRRVLSLSECDIA